MNNLKRVLSTVLAGTMLAGMMVVGASAAGFPDAEKIEHTEAVDTLVALNIVTGKDNGNYDPEGYVTRGEMAKLITVALNGGKAPVLGIKTTPTYSDIDGHWAESYIEYCSNLGIIGGRGDGTFDPDGNVTGSEAAKMMLVAMGWDSTVFNFTGADWALNVNTEANKVNLYDEIETIDPSVALNRDATAQLVYNGILAPMMEKSPNMSITNGNITWDYTLMDGINGAKKTIFSSKFGGKEEYGYLTAKDYDEVNEIWTYTLKANTGYFGGNTITKDGVNNFGTLLVESTEDYTGLFGQKVRVIYKDRENLYGIYAADSSVLASGVAGDIGDIDTTKKTVSVGGKSVKFDSVTAANVYNVFEDTTADMTITALKAIDAPCTFDVIDNDGDSKADAVIVTPLQIAKITYVGADTVTFGAPISDSFDKADFAIYEDYAKNDWVVRTAAAYAAKEVDTYAPIELKTAAVDAVKGRTVASTTYTDYKIDGSWLYSTTTGGYTTVKAELNDSIEYVAMGSVVFYSKVVDAAATTKNIAVVITADNVGGEGENSQLGSDSVKAKLIFTDGSKEIVKIAKLDGSDVTDETDLDSILGKLVTYRVNAYGSYELTTVSGSNLAGYKTYSATEAYNNKAIAGTELADDAIVIAYKGHSNGSDSSNDAKIYTGKEFKNTYGTGTFGTSGQVLTGVENGFSVGKIATVTNNGGLPSITTGSNYGYLVAGSYYTYENDKTYINLKFWNGSEDVEAKWESTDELAPYAAGAIITFDTVDSTEVKNVTIVNAITSVVTGYDGGEKIQIASIPGTGITKVDTKDTVVLYVNSTTKKGVEGASIQVGEDTDDNGVADRNNIRYVGNSTMLDLLVVDVNNYMKAGPAAYVAASAADTQTELNALFTSTNKVVVDGNLTLTEALAVPAGKTLEINGTLSFNSKTLTVAAGGALTVNGLSGSAGDLVLSAKTADYAGSKVTIATAGNNGVDILEHSNAKKVGATATIGSVVAGTKAAADSWYTTEGTTGLTISDDVVAGTYTYYAADSIIKTSGTAATHDTGWYLPAAVTYVQTH